MTEAVTLEPGTRMEDGSVYAGLTADGKQQILAMPTDLDVTMNFNDAATVVKKMNADKALGHDDWQIGSLEVTRVLQENRDKGALKGTFNTTDKRSGFYFPYWYWSSTPNRLYPTNVDSVRFSDGFESWNHKDSIQLSCRPVRLVPVGAL
jgi:hypothetical protein